MHAIIMTKKGKIQRRIEKTERTSYKLLEQFLIIGFDTGVLIKIKDVNDNDNQ